MPSESVKAGMPEVVLCKDGMEVALESAEGLWVVLRDSQDKRILGRFEIDASELLSTIKGAISYQATDGLGNSVRFEGFNDRLKVRFDSGEHPPKLCQLELDAVRSALRSIDVSV